MLFHPETLNDVSPLEQLLTAIEPFSSDYTFVFIGSNADTHADQITKRVKQFCETHETCRFYSNLHPDAYHYIVKQSAALIGNSR